MTKKENDLRLPHEERKALLLSTAIELANEKGLMHVNFKTVSEASKQHVTPRTVQHYWNIGLLRRAIIADKRCNQLPKDDAVAMGIC